MEHKACPNQQEFTYMTARTGKCLRSPPAGFQLQHPYRCQASRRPFKTLAGGSQRTHLPTPENPSCTLVAAPKKSQIRGLCVSPDLQCVLCVTEGLEGVYLLAIDNLWEQGEANPHPTEAVPSLDDGAAASTLYASAGVDGNSGLAGAARVGDGDTPDGKQGKSGGGGGNKRSPAATTARHAPRRTVADTAFPSLAHLASRGEQRKRAGSAKARHPLAEPVFIASLSRRGGGGAGGGGSGESKGGLRQESGDRVNRRHSTGSGGRGPRARGGGGARMAAALFECLWWVTRDGDHFAIIGGPGGEVRIRESVL